MLLSKPCRTLYNGRGTSSAFKPKDENTPSFVLGSDVQHNKCADAANASGNKGSLTVAACGTQQSQCSQVAQAAGTGNKVRDDSFLPE
jgi:hypothetical protein